MASLLAVMSLSCEVLPEFSQQPPQLTPSSSATQNFTDEQIDNYAKTVLEIESQRATAYKKIEEILDGSPPDITCDQKDTFNNLPTAVQEIAVQYCLNSQEIAKKNGLTQSQFNAITIRLQADRELKTRIQNAMIYIQRQENSGNQS
jgi:hypothetical protein